MTDSPRPGLRALFRLFILASLLLASAGSWAHKASDSYLRLAVQGSALTGQIDLALRDIDFALGLDANDDGDITWGELRGQREALVGWALQRLSADRGGACSLQAGALQVDQHTDGTYAVLPLTGTCPAASGELTLGYRLLFDVDALHRGLLNLTLDGANQTAVFSPTAPLQHFAGGAVSRWTQFQQYLVEGIWHIWKGFDHVLFLLSLLLPAVLVFQRDAAGNRQWHGVASLRIAGGEVLAVVTAFTLAHSITLSLATLQIVTLPSRLVESTIALSVVLAAANNLYPLVQGRRWMAAFGFGLIHGFGFASVLADLGLPREALVLSLVGFNAGVEVGQLAIVALFLPLAYRLRDGGFYRVAVFQAGSWLTLAVAALWFCERAFDLRIISA
ncbi:MAG: HupE/UreJ family protein [Leptothrix sp. (in: b-proteobacteria)]